ncbi:MAG: HAD family hydrolase [Myxococcales bacterium]|nr:HAD family hydrolase [Myxococcales bacterium]
MEPRGLRKPGGDELLSLARSVELVVLDVDGVLTDGSLYYGPRGEALKRFDVRDGHGAVLARLTGLKVAVLTARKSRAVEVRARELGLAKVMQGHKDKRAGLERLLAELSVRPQACAYMGDDVNDLSPMALAGLPACPADAALEVRQEALFIARLPGGHGAARELIELILKASGRWPKALELMRSGKVSP